MSARDHLQISATHFPRVCAVAAFAVCSVFGSPARAFAQTDKWEVDVAPLCFWVASGGNKVVLLTEADIGGGSAFTHSAPGGVE